MFKNKLTQRIQNLEIIVDAVITVLIRKKFLTRADIQKQIIKSSTLEDDNVQNTKEDSNA